MLRRLPALLSIALLASAAGGAPRELAPRPLGPSAYAQQTPMVAFAGGKYLTVWLESLDRAGWRYLGAFSDAGGKRLSPSAFVVVPSGIAGPGQLIGLGDSFALFFPHDQGVQMLDVNLAGQVTATRVIPMQHFAADPSVAWNGTHFAAVEAHRLVFFDRSGTIVRRVALPCNFIRHELVSVRTDVIVANTCEGGLRADVVASDGSIRSTVLDPAHPEPGIRIAAAPAAGGATLLVWGESLWLQSAILSSAGLSERHVIVNSESQPLTPLVLMPAPDGFLLPFAEHGRIGIATLTAGGQPDDARFEESFGRPASAATNGSTILVADIHHDTQISRGLVRTRLIEANAEVGATDLLSITPSRQGAPVLGAGSGTILAAWTEQQGTQPAVRAAHVAADGTPFPGANRVLNSFATLASHDLSWNGSHYLTVVLNGSNNRLFALRTTAFGQTAGSSTVYTVPGNVTPRSAVVWAGDRWIVAGTDTVIAFLAEVSAGGQVGGWTHLPLQGTLPDEFTQRTGVYDVALTYDGEQVYIAWIEGQYRPCQVTCIEARPAFVATVSRFGDEIGPPARISEPFALSDSLSLATNGEEIVAVVNGHDGGATVTTLGGATRTFDGIGDVEWDGSTFVLALREREQLTVRRLDARLRDAARARVTNIAPADTDRSAPSVAVAFPGNAIVGVQEVDPVLGARAVVYVEQELAYEAPRRRVVRR